MMCVCLSVYCKCLWRIHPLPWPRSNLKADVSRASREPHIDPPAYKTKSVPASADFLPSQMATLRSRHYTILRHRGRHCTRRRQDVPRFRLQSSAEYSCLVGS